MVAREGARDADIGLDGFLTTTTPLGGRLKVRVEDFRVAELGGEPAEDPDGPFVYARIRLTNWETNRFVGAASERLRISRKKIHFSGTKDKRGVTDQLFTFEAPLEAVRDLAKVPGVTIAESYRCAAEASLGDHLANSFDILVRDVPMPADEVRLVVEATHTEAVKMGGLPNYYGPQRFGAMRATTHRVGQRMLQGDFRGAVQAYLGSAPLQLGPEDAKRWTEGVAREDYATLLQFTAPDQGFERTLLHRLHERPGDYVHALLGLPKNLQVLFVYAYQSYCFNRILSRRLHRGLPIGAAVEGDLIAPIEKGEVRDEWIPVAAHNLARVNEEIRRGRAVVTGLLPGTEVPYATGGPGAIESAVVGEEGLTRSSFVVPEHLEWSSKGSRRALSVKLDGFRHEVGPDDLHPGRSSVRVEFRLPKGAYATSVLREFLKSDRLADYA